MPTGLQYNNSGFLLKVLQGQTTNIKQNASDRLISRLVTAEERISKFENMPIENSLTEMQRDKKKRTKYPGTVVSFNKYNIYGCEIPEDKERK